jgi:hypothetical protein
MRHRTHRLLATAVSVVMAFAAHSIGAPTPAAADATFTYGVNYPNGNAAVDYAYGPDGMWRPLVNVEYRWNYYKRYATPRHPYDHDALIRYADGTHAMTARDANGHLLLDFNHDGEIDVTTAGSAFQEHNGKGAENRTLAAPFSIFWFDDNWLARFMAQAYGRPLPNGLSDYSDLTRWRILAGDTSNWTPYGTDHFDRLALDGLYYLARGQVLNAVAKWTQIRDKSGNQFDFHTGLYIYPEMTENYHRGLFKILTDQLLARGQLGDSRQRELVQHSVSLRSAIIENQEPAGSTLAGWTTNVTAGTTLMNTESLAVNVLALGAAAKTTFGAGQPPLAAQPNDYFLSPQGIFSAQAGFSRPGHMTYGPYANYPTGSYTVDFVMRSANPTGTVAHLDIYDARAGRVLAERDVTAADLGTDNQWQRIALPVTVSTAPNRLEFRTWWYGRSDLGMAEIRVR